MGARKTRDPAPAEIERMCAEIRTQWNELTYKVRAGYGRNIEAVQKNEAWLPPLVDCSDLDRSVEASSY